MEPNYNPFINSPESEENNNKNSYETPPFQYRPRRPVNFFETSAMILGIGALVCCTCFYGSYIFGALAILFALLSRGGQMKMSSKAKLGLILGIVAIVLSTLVTIAAFAYALSEYGSMEGIIREYCNLYGYDYEEFMSEFYQ